MKIEIELPKLDCDYDRVELRQPTRGDYYWDGFRWVKAWMDHERNCKYLCVTPMPAKKYREPILPPDYEKECEFSDDGKRWVKGLLVGWSKLEDVDEFTWINASGCGYKYARIEVAE
jgi:hypothetical protein